jgi:hypothetical protein
MAQPGKRLQNNPRRNTGEIWTMNSSLSLMSVQMELSVFWETQVMKIRNAMSAHPNSFPVHSKFRALAFGLM